MIFLYLHGVLADALNLAVTRGFQRASVKSFLASSRATCISPKIMCATFSPIYITQKDKLIRRIAMGHKGYWGSVLWRKLGEETTSLELRTEASIVDAVRRLVNKMKCMPSTSSRLCHEPSKLLGCGKGIQEECRRRSRG